MEQMGRNVTMQKWGFLANSRYLLHDRDSKFCPSFRQLIEAGRVKTMPLPARSPNLNLYAERWVRSVKQECLSKLILFGERPLRRALQQYVAHYHEERAITRASRTGSCSPCRIEGRAGRTELCVARNDWVVC
jgi:hypothetical protein